MDGSAFVDLQADAVWPSGLTDSGGPEGERIADPHAAALDLACGEFQDAARSGEARSGFSYVDVLQAHDGSVFIEVDRVDRIPHSPAVYLAAGIEQASVLSGRQFAGAQKTAPSLEHAASPKDVACEHLAVVLDSDEAMAGTQRISNRLE